jgi:hypothetical protein
MSTEANQAALQDFWQSTAPMSQVRENLNPPNGQYDLTVTKLEPQLDDNGLVFINSEFTIIGPASIANAKVGNTFRPRLYIGTKKDQLAKLPETRINSPGLAVLKGIGRVAQVPCNDQPVAQLCTALLGKSFSNRIETKKVKHKETGEEKEYCNFGRNPTPIGIVPARLDSEAATPVAAAPVANGAAAEAVSGAQFGSE